MSMREKIIQKLYQNDCTNIISQIKCAFLSLQKHKCFYSPHRA